MDELPRGSRSRRRSHSRSRRQSDHRSRSNSPDASSTGGDNNQKQTQFIPIPVPYYHPQQMPATQTTPATQQSKTQAPTTMLNNNPSTMSYMVPQTKQYNDDNLQSAVRYLHFNLREKSITMKFILIRINRQTSSNILIYNHH